ncbi:MAG: hypothetical protein IJX16_06180 [Clostridia bacterium]|nr:hypothetical protein [Clostridia bacterium]
MDKFGIFKLLNSFFNLYGQKPPEEKANSSTDSGQSSSVFSDLLKSLSSKAPANNTDKNSTKNSDGVKSSFMPLQADMIKTMNSHDEFIKRVKQKNPQ